METERGPVRIGELARRTGVSPELLRAWEQRYGLLQPSRSQGGFRLYSDSDERRVRTMRALIAQGLSAAEAAGRARADEPDPVAASSQPIVGDLADQLAEALRSFDTQRAHAVFDRLVATVSVESLLRDVLVPYLRTLGDRWATGQASIAQEHFASNLLRGRLMGLAREGAIGSGTPVIVACPPEEEHDLGSIMFCIAAARLGRRVVFLGADTPVDTIRETAESMRPSTVVLAVSRPEPLRAHAEALRALTALVPVLVCGEGAIREDVEALGAIVLGGDPVTAAQSVAS
jgi:DNA-binding transcriptional MerR regulator